MCHGSFALGGGIGSTIGLLIGRLGGLFEGAWLLLSFVFEFLWFIDLLVFEAIWSRDLSEVFPLSWFLIKDFDNCVSLQSSIFVNFFFVKSQVTFSQS